MTQFVFKKFFTLAMFNASCHSPWLNEAFGVSFNQSMIWLKKILLIFNIGVRSLKSSSKVKSKMEPLVTTKLVLIRLYMYPAHGADSISSRWKIFSHTIVAVLLAVSLTGLAGTLTFYFEFMSIDLQQSLLALIPAGALFNSAYNLVAAIVLRYKTKHIFELLSDIYRSS